MVKIIGLLILGLLLIPNAISHGNEEQHLFVEAFDDDGYYFMIGGYDGKNPTIVLEPALRYNITFANRGSTATDFRFEDGNRQDFPVVAAGGIANFGAYVPNAGATNYWSTQLRDQGMEGRVVESEEALETPLIPIAVLAAALIVMTNRRRI